MTDESVAHLAGNAVEFAREEGPVLRQRCSWCGATLIDVDLGRISVPVDQAQDPYPIWEVGAFVVAYSPDGQGGMWTTVDWDAGDPVPENACMRMPLEVTG